MEIMHHKLRVKPPKTKWGLMSSEFMHERVKIFTREVPLGCIETAINGLFGRASVFFKSKHEMCKAAMCNQMLVNVEFDLINSNNH